MNENFKKAKAIEKKNKEKLLEINPLLTDNSGIYILTREDESGIKHAYIGQSVRILTRMAQHMVGYTQHIDLSIRKHGFYSDVNKYGWKINLIETEKSRMDELEQHYILIYRASFEQRDRSRHP